MFYFIKLTGGSELGQCPLNKSQAPHDVSNNANYDTWTYKAMIFNDI